MPPVDIDESILRRLFRRSDEPARLARACGLSLVDLARWASDSHHADLLAGLERVSDACFRAALSRSRVVAARTLTRLASGEADDSLTDLARRSCVDLLSASAERRRDTRSAPPARATGDRARRSAGPGATGGGPDAPPPAPSEEAILAALERAAREDDAPDGHDAEEEHGTSVSAPSSAAACEQPDAA